MTTGHNRLVVLAEAIRTEHAAALEAARATAERALEAGRLLVEAKALVGHGGWAGWLKEHVGFSDRTAQRYMQLHRAGLESATVADLGIKGAAAAIARHRPEPAEFWTDPFPLPKFGPDEGLVGTAEAEGKPLLLCARLSVRWPDCCDVLLVGRAEAQTTWPQRPIKRFALAAIIHDEHKGPWKFEVFPRPDVDDVFDREMQTLARFRLDIAIDEGRVFRAAERVSPGIVRRLLDQFSSDWSHARLVRSELVRMVSCDWADCVVREKQPNVSAYCKSRLYIESIGAGITDAEIRAATLDELQSRGEECTGYEF